MYATKAEIRKMSRTVPLSGDQKRREARWLKATSASWQALAGSKLHYRLVGPFRGIEASTNIPAIQI